MFFVCEFVDHSATKMKVKPLVCLLLAGFVTNVKAQNYLDYSENTNYDLSEINGSEVISTDRFISKPQVFFAEIGDLVRLPCEVDEKDDDIFLLWKRHETEILYDYMIENVYTIGGIPNIRKTSKGLEVIVLLESDFGSYSCLILATATNSPKITHIIKHLSPPTIHSIYTANNKTVFNVGETLDLTCNVAGTSPFQIFWFKDAERLAPNGKNLVIQNLEPRHAGNYRCIADNRIEPATQSFIIIAVLQKPEVSVGKAIVNSDRDAELTCTVHAYPNPVIVWKKDGINIVKNEPRIMLKRHENNMELDLLIRNLTEADFGRYTCAAKNSLGKAEKSVDLVKIPAIQRKIALKSKPDEYDYATVDETYDTADEITAEFKSIPQIFFGKIGDVIQLPCEVTNPDIVLLWRRNDTQILYQDNIMVEYIPNIRKTSTGLEVNITSESDFGTYSCVMIISINNTPNVTHAVMPLFPPTIHSVYTADNKTIYRVGETLNVTCRATGAPPPKICWAKGKELMAPEGMTLLISNLKRRDAGVYTCLADNKVEPAVLSFISIEVQHAPTVSIEKYVVYSQHESDAELKCTVQAYPPAQIVWHKDGVNVVANDANIEVNRHGTKVESILLLKNLTEADLGRYTCRAKNSIGKAEKSVNLVKIPVIQKVIGLEKKNTEVTLTWQVESNSPVTEHQVQYWKKVYWTDIRPNVTANVNDTYTARYTLPCLAPGTYEVRTRSKNAHGWSDFSETVEFMEEKPKPTPVEEYDDDNSEGPISTEFKTKPKVFLAEVGDVVQLPCEVTKPDPYIMWLKNDTQYLYVYRVPELKISNIRKTSTGLEVNITSESDFGRYTCMSALLLYESNVTHVIKPANNNTLHSFRRQQITGAQDNTDRKCNQ